ncbi:putative membrane-bound spermidine synthase [Streptomyces sp. SAI-133]|nr:putative membrane-bound spermidine synthase [Streptomyces sp. SAI-133]
MHPAMNGPHARVLVLGGGDGLAAREVLRFPGVRRVDLVALDPAVVDLARHDPALSRLNGHVYGDARVHVSTADAFRGLRTSAPGPSYDVVIADLPDPGVTASTKLYSQEFYGLVRRVLAPGGRFVVHTGPVSSRRRVFWTVEATLRAAGLRTTPYRVGCPGFGADSGRTTAGVSRAPRDWGFVLASRGRRPALALDPLGPRPATLTAESLRAARKAARATRVEGLAASTLVHPRY